MSIFQVFPDLQCDVNRGQREWPSAFVVKIARKFSEIYWHRCSWSKGESLRHWGLSRSKLLLPCVPQRSIRICFLHLHLIKDPFSSWTWRTRWYQNQNQSPQKLCRSACELSASTLSPSLAHLTLSEPSNLLPHPTRCPELVWVVTIGIILLHFLQ